MEDTIQVKIPYKYKLLFGKQFFDNINKTQLYGLDNLLDKLGIDFDLLKEISYLNGVTNDLKEGNYTISDKLGRNIK